MYHKFMNSTNKINVCYPPPPRTVFEKESIPLLVKKNSVKDIIGIFDKEKVLPIKVESQPDVYDDPLKGIALLKNKLININRYKIKNK